MPPHSEEVEVKSTLGVRPFVNKPFASKYGLTWLEDKRKIDGAEGLWRIYDDLYDLTEFINKHPGGPEWLTLTKGTDITEAFEVHHISTYPEEILKKYFVRKAVIERGVPFTFKEDGFYKTLKREVREVLKTVPKQPVKTTALFIDVMFAGIFLFAILGCMYWNFWLSALSASLLASTTVAAHNYFHMKDNFRMYYFNLSLMNLREWRISHVLSHHLHTNTIVDMELYGFEPLVQYTPHKKTTSEKIRSALLFPILCLVGFYIHFMTHCIAVYKYGMGHFRLSDLLGFTLPLAMYYFGGQSLFDTLVMWTFIILVGSFQFFLVGQNAAHHHPDILHEGDTPRATKDLDWGVSQLDAVMDRIEVTGSHYLVLTTFGDHALHHMFPTLDHGILELLYPTFNKVMKQFGLDLRMNKQLEMVKAHFQQAFRTTPNPNPPDLSKKYI